MHVCMYLCSKTNTQHTFCRRCGSTGSEGVTDDSMIYCLCANKLLFIFSAVCPLDSTKLSLLVRNLAVCALSQIKSHLIYSRIFTPLATNACINSYMLYAYPEFSECMTLCMYMYVQDFQVLIIAHIHVAIGVLLFRLQRKLVSC